jgi:uncharacterized protein
MGNSLIDQMKKAGLVNKAKANKAKQDQYKNKKQKSKKGSAEQLDEAKLLAQKAQAEKVERDRQINLKNKEEAERKAIAAQIVQLIETNRVEDSDGEIVYNFTDGNVVKRLFVSEKIHQHLISDKLSIAKLGDSYELVPKPVAEKIKQRDADCIIKNDDVVEAADDDDPYADYTIPDDLIW